MRSKYPPTHGPYIKSYDGDILLTSSQLQVEKLRDTITPYLNNLHDWLE